MKSLALIVWALFAPVALAHAQEPERRPPAGMVGVVRLPGIFGEGPCERSQSKAVPLYSAPRASAPIGTIEVTRPAQLEQDGGCRGRDLGLRMRDGKVAATLATIEIEYELPAAIALAKSGPWCQLLLHSGTAWIHEECEAGFISIEALLADKPLYLLKGAIDQARSQPGGSGAMPSGLQASARNHGQQPLSARMLGHRSVGGHTWLHLAASWVNDCERSPSPQEVFELWLPLRDASGRPQVWFHSRGC